MPDGVAFTGWPVCDLYFPSFFFPVFFCETLLHFAAYTPITIPFDQCDLVCHSQISGRSEQPSKFVVQDCRLSLEGIHHDIAAVESALSRKESTARSFQIENLENARTDLDFAAVLVLVYTDQVFVEALCCAEIRLKLVFKLVEGASSRDQLHQMEDEFALFVL